MREEMIEAIFSALKNYKSRGCDIGYCTFYGSESLLAKNMTTMRKIAEHCRELDTKMGGNQQRL